MTSQATSGGKTYGVRYGCEQQKKETKENRRAQRRAEESKGRREQKRAEESKREHFPRFLRPLAPRTLRPLALQSRREQKRKAEESRRVRPLLSLKSSLSDTSFSARWGR
jgi:hypothetical protein